VRRIVDAYDRHAASRAPTPVGGAHTAGQARGEVTPPTPVGGAHTAGQARGEVTPPDLRERKRA
jgi:hypothetical protein